MRRGDGFPFLDFYPSQSPMPSTNGSPKIAIAGISFSHHSIFINLLFADTRTDNKR
jgi:hypothetical protein